VCAEEGKEEPRLTPKGGKKVLEGRERERTKRRQGAKKQVREAASGDGRGCWGMSPGERKQGGPEGEATRVEERQERAQTRTFGGAATGGAWAGPAET
jgi:hypothetical protein